MKETWLQLASQLGKILLARGWKITTAESCTGGGVGYAITSVSGSSAWFEQGIISYANGVKRDLLDVAETTLDQFGAVSKQTVEQMAVGAAKGANAQVAVSVSGVAGPDGGSAEKPVGTVWFGFYVDGQTTCIKCHFEGDRHQVREQAIEFSLAKIAALLTK